MRAQFLAKALIALSLFAAAPALAADSKYDNYTQMQRAPQSLVESQTGQLAASKVNKHKCPFAPDFGVIVRDGNTTQSQPSAKPKAGKAE